MTGKLIDIRERLLDAADLMIDFATLGEYGIEPEPVRDCEERAPRLASGAPHHLHDRAGSQQRWPLNPLERFQSGRTTRRERVTKEPPLRGGS
jgi:hypothetical protein